MYWIYLILGTWIAISPWVVGVMGIDLGLSSMVAGALVILLALWHKFGQSKE